MPGPEHDCAEYRRKFGFCTVCAATPPAAELALGQVQCAFGCGEPVDPNDPRTWQQVAGWARPRQQGGTNAIALRQPLARWAHHECIDAAKHGRLAQPPFPLADDDSAKVT